jgi:hypothetical protein
MLTVSTAAATEEEAMLNYKQYLLRILAVCAALTIAACASKGLGEMSEITSAPTPVNPREDNAAVIAGQTAALVVTLDIDGERVKLAGSRVMMVPQSTPRREEGELVSIVGLRGGEMVSRILVPDQRINIQENRGIVILEKRTLNAALPLPVPIDEIGVQLPGVEQTVKFAVGSKIKAFCGKHPDQDMCRKGREDMPIVK